MTPLSFQLVHDFDLPDPGGSHARSVDERGAGGPDQEDDGAVGAGVRTLR